jgi:DNA repair protein RadC
MLPREKLKAKGIDKLSNSELVAVILTTGTRKENILTLSERLIDDYIVGDAVGISDFEELAMKYKLPPVKSMQLAATFELGRRIYSRAVIEKPLLNSAEKVANFYEKLAQSSSEKMFIAMVDSRFRLIKSQLVAAGGLNLIMVTARDVLAPVLRYEAAGVFVVHNHPSGITTPSREDKEFTGRLRKAADMLGVSIIDHLIVGDSYYSFKQNGGL